MKVSIVLLLALVLCNSEDLKAYYQYCHDGDTCTVNLDNPGGYIPSVFADKISIRLNGIDTAEMTGGCELSRCLARMARDYLIQLLYSSQYLTLHDVSRDKYFRINTRVWYQCGSQWCDASQTLLYEGLAVEYDGGTKVTDWCSKDPSTPFYKNALKCMGKTSFLNYMD